MDAGRSNALWEANAETWTQLARAGYDVHRDLVNTPGFLAMLPPVAGLHGLDIGCGEGANTRSVARLGARMDAIDVAHTIEIARYFDRVDGQIERWMFSAAPEDARASVEPFEVPIYHHTLADWINDLVEAGFTIERLGEPSVDDATAAAHPIVADTQIAPLFLHIRARRSHGSEDREIAPKCGYVMRGDRR